MMLNVLLTASCDGFTALRAVVQVICEYCTYDGTDKILIYNVEFLKYG